jgi:hypothetical protein
MSTLSHISTLEKSENLTSTFTILCPYGIVMAADSVGTIRNHFSNEIEKIIPNIRKIYCVSKTDFGISFWGLGTVQDKPILDFLAEFEETSVEKTDTLDQVADKLRDHFSKVTPKISERMGLHLAGYVMNEGKPTPQLRHIFHETWHLAGDFVAENCHIESLAANGRVKFPSYRPYPPLFNGDNAIANCLVNVIPYMNQGSQKIAPASLKLEECIELAELVVGVSIQRLNYYVDAQYRKVPKTVGGTVYIAKITQAKGFEWVKKENWLDLIKLWWKKENS